MPTDRYGEPVDQADGASTRRGGPSAARWEVVPKGTAPSICSGHKKAGGSCRAEVFWIERAKIRKGKPVPGQTARVPVDCDVVDGARPDSFSEGKGVSHYSTCPDANKF